tara:strand:- start:3653 stop:5203 length:1551 start_codon:yes stop_codon:yes gene_type:complete
MPSRGRLLVLWNQIEEDIYEKWRDEGPRPLAWDPSRVVPDVGTVDEEMGAFIKALEDARFDVELVNVEDSLDRAIGAIRLHRPDAIFNLVEFFNDDQIQEAYIAGLYEMMNIPFTGNRPMNLATCQNKFRTKLLLEAAGLPTADFMLAKTLPVPMDHGLIYPLIVKPAFEDASGGIEKDSVVHNHMALEARVAFVHKEFEMPALVEEYVDGREIHAAVLGNNPPEVLPLFEMEFDDSEFNPNDEWRPQIISYRAKWDPHSKDFYTMDAVVPPVDLDPTLAAEIRRIAREAYIAVGCRDYARVDMRIEDDEIYILEVNPNPDLVDGAAFMLCASASGRTYSETLGAIADLAIARGRPAPLDPKLLGKPTDTLLLEHEHGTGPAAPKVYNEPPAHYNDPVAVGEPELDDELDEELRGHGGISDEDEDEDLDESGDEDFDESGDDSLDEDLEESGDDSIDEDLGEDSNDELGDEEPARVVAAAKFDDDPMADFESTVPTAPAFSDADLDDPKPSSDGKS